MPMQIDDVMTRRHGNQIPGRNIRLVDCENCVLWLGGWLQERPTLAIRRRVFDNMNIRIVLVIADGGKHIGQHRIIW